jgi:hypothetical protein
MIFLKRGTYVIAGYGRGWVMDIVVMVEEIVFIKTKREHG